MILEEVMKGLADALAYATLALMLYGVWRGTQRRAGRMSGPRARWLSIPWFYLVTTLLFLGLCYVGWHPLPFPLHGTVQAWLFAAGSLMYFAGIVLVWWGRLELGRNYFASGALAARLFEEHQLIMTGPFAIVRHPMYLGLMLAAVGSLPMYFTWTALFFALFAPVLLVRAQIEERVLAAEFREAWWAYCARVPMLIPRIGLRRGSVSQQEPVVHRRDIDWQK